MNDVEKFLNSEEGTKFLNNKFQEYIIDYLQIRISQERCGDGSSSKIIELYLKNYDNLGTNIIFASEYF